MEFKELISYENLYRAHRVARLGKRHKREVIEFEMNLSENLWAMHYELLYGKYKIGEYRCFMIYDPKEREIQAIGYRDRILQHVLCDYYLMPLLEKKLIYYNVACRRGKGTSLAHKALRHFMTEHYKKYGTGGYFVKADITKYFANINHALLKEKLSAIVDIPEISRLLFEIIDSYGKDKGRGLPLGNQSSQDFALLYLDCVDKYISATLGAGHYIRYMDDIIVLASDKTSASKILSELEERIQENLLSLNPKSQIISVKNGISFLGWCFRFGENGKVIQTLKKASKQRIVKHFSHTLKDKTKDISLVLSSYNGHLKSGRAHGVFERLKEMSKRKNKL